MSFADNRVIVTGRWFGVRGRRFVRPTLTLGTGGAGSLLLAELEHKPWSAADGESWTAAFMCRPSAGGADQLELTVAPDIAVSLPAPDVLRARPPRAKRSDARRRKNTATRPNESDQRAEIARLRELLNRNELTRAEWNAALSKRDAAVAKLDAVLRERDAVTAERDAAIRERDAAVAARDEAAAARDAVVDERDAVADERRSLVRERDASQLERDALKRRRRELERAQTALVRERDQLRTELDAALAARESVPTSHLDPTPAVRPVLEATRRTQTAPALRPEPASRIRAANIPKPSTAPLVEQTRRIPSFQLAGRFRRVPSLHPVEDRSPTAIWVTRAIAVAVLVAVVVALLLIVQSV